jgi:hypothetical protein
MTRDDRRVIGRPGDAEPTAGRHETRHVPPSVPGKVTRSSKLSPRRAPAVQRKAAATGMVAGASPARPASDQTMDPWMDAAHRGLTAVQAHGHGQAAPARASGPQADTRRALERRARGAMREDWMRVAVAPHLYQTPELVPDEPEAESWFARMVHTLVAAPRRAPVQAKPVRDGQASRAGEAPGVSDRPAEENAYMHVVAYDASGAPVAEWHGEAFFYGALPVRYVGHGPPWRWDRARGRDHQARQRCRRPER